MNNNSRKKLTRERARTHIHTYTLLHSN